MELITAFGVLFFGLALLIGHRAFNDMVMRTQRAVLRHLLRPERLDRYLSSQEEPNRVVAVALGFGWVVGGIVMLILILV